MLLLFPTSSPAVIPQATNEAFVKSLMVLSVNNYAYFKMINFVVQLIALIYENDSKQWIDISSACVIMLIRATTENTAHLESGNHRAHCPAPLPWGVCGLPHARLHWCPLWGKDSEPCEGRRPLSQHVVSIQPPRASQSSGEQPGRSATTQEAPERPQA